MNARFTGLFGGAAIIAAAVAILCANAEAAPISLPPAQYYNAANVTLPNSLTFFNGGFVPTSAHIDETVYPGTPWHWGFSTSNNYGIPSVSASAQAGPGVKGAVGSDLTYYVVFSGAAGDIQVNVQASGAASANGENILNGYGHNVASAWFEIAPYFDNGGTGSVIASGSAFSNERGAGNSGLQTFSFNQNVTFTANLIYQISMNTTAEAWDDQIATAFLDPIFMAPAGYSILTSPGIGNGLAVTPIPAALPLFTSGLGALGLLGWRKRRKGAVRAS